MQFLFSISWLRRFAPRLAIVSVALLLLAALAACGGGSSSGSSSTSSGLVNLTIWSWVSGLDKSAALFNQTHPNIHVTVSNVGAGPVEYDKLFTAIKANNEPDVAEVEFQTLPQFETTRSEEHTSELQSRQYLVCRLLLEKKKKKNTKHT